MKESREGLGERRPPSRLTAREMRIRKAIDEAGDKGYLIAGSYDPLFHVYWSDCERAKRPFIFAWGKRLIFHLRTVKRVFTRQGMDRISRLLAENCPKREWHYNQHEWFVCKVPRDKLEGIIRGLLAIMRDDTIDDPEELELERWYGSFWKASEDDRGDFKT